jgi:hypothetical protein
MRETHEHNLLSPLAARLHERAEARARSNAAARAAVGAGPAGSSRATGWRRALERGQDEVAGRMALSERVAARWTKTSSLGSEESSAGSALQRALGVRPMRGVGALSSDGWVWVQRQDGAPQDEVEADEVAPRWGGSTTRTVSAWADRSAPDRRRAAGTRAAMTRAVQRAGRAVEAPSARHLERVVDAAPRSVRRGLQHVLEDLSHLPKAEQQVAATQLLAQLGGLQGALSRAASAAPPRRQLARVEARARAAQRPEHQTARQQAAVRARQATRARSSSGTSSAARSQGGARPSGGGARAPAGGGARGSGAGGDGPAGRPAGDEPWRSGAPGPLTPDLVVVDGRSVPVADAQVQPGPVAGWVRRDEGSASSTRPGATRSQEGSAVAGPRVESGGRQFARPAEGRGEQVEARPWGGAAPVLQDGPFEHDGWDDEDLDEVVEAGPLARLLSRNDHPSSAAAARWSWLDEREASARSLVPRALPGGRGGEPVVRSAAAPGAGELVLPTWAAAGPAVAAEAEQEGARAARPAASDPAARTRAGSSGVAQRGARQAPVQAAARRWSGGDPASLGPDVAAGRGGAVVRRSSDPARPSVATRWLNENASSGDRAASGGQRAWWPASPAFDGGFGEEGGRASAQTPAPTSGARTDLVDAHQTPRRGSRRLLPDLLPPQLGGAGVSDASALRREARLNAVSEAVIEPASLQRAHARALAGSPEALVGQRGGARSSLSVPSATGFVREPMAFVRQPALAVDGAAEDVDGASGSVQTSNATDAGARRRAVEAQTGGAVARAARVTPASSGSAADARRDRGEDSGAPAARGGLEDSAGPARRGDGRTEEADPTLARARGSRQERAARGTLDADFTLPTSARAEVEQVQGASPPAQRPASVRSAQPGNGSPVGPVVGSARPAAIPSVRTTTVRMSGDPSAALARVLSVVERAAARVLRAQRFDAAQDVSAPTSVSDSPVAPLARLAAREIGGSATLSRILEVAGRLPEWRPSSVAASRRAGLEVDWVLPAPAVSAGGPVAKEPAPTEAVRRAPSPMQRSLSRAARGGSSAGRGAELQAAAPAAGVAQRHLVASEAAPVGSAGPSAASFRPRAGQRGVAAAWRRAARGPVAGERAADRALGVDPEVQEAVGQAREAAAEAVAYPSAGAPRALRSGLPSAAPDLAYIASAGWRGQAAAGGSLDEGGSVDRAAARRGEDSPRASGRGVGSQGDAERPGSEAGSGPRVPAGISREAVQAARVLEASDRGIVRALSRASGTAELVRVLVERSAEAQVLARELPGPAGRVVQQIASMRTLPDEAVEMLSAPTVPSAGGGSGAVRRRLGRASTSARTVHGGGGSGPSTTRSTEGAGAGRLMALSQKLMDLIHLAEVERKQGDAQRQVRRSDEKVEGPVGGVAEDADAASGVTLESLQRDVLEAVQRELELIRDRGEGGSNGGIWW